MNTILLIINILWSMFNAAALFVMSQEPYDTKQSLAGLRLQINKYQKELKRMKLLRVLLSAREKQMEDLIKENKEMRNKLNEKDS